MAEEKKGVILYADWIHTFNELTDEEAGKLIKHFFCYVNDLNPEAPDKLTKLLFQPIKMQLKRDLEKWEDIKKGRSIAGKIGGLRSGAARKKQIEANEASASKSKQTEANEAVNVNVNVNNDEEEAYKIQSPFITFYSAGTHLTFDGEFAHYAYKQTNKSIDQLKNLVSEFLIEQSAVGKLTWKDVRDLRMHFINWVKKKPVSTGLVYTGPSKKVINHNPERNVA